jgi:hypothetical protein
LEARNGLAKAPEISCDLWVTGVAGTNQIVRKAFSQPQRRLFLFPPFFFPGRFLLDGSGKGYEKSRSTAQFNQNCY